MVKRAGVGMFRRFVHARILWFGLTLAVSATSLLTGQTDTKTFSPDKANAERHASMFDYMKLGAPVEKRTPSANGEIDLSGGMLNDYAAADPRIPRASSSKLLGILASRSDLIVMAKALGFQSGFTPDRSFLYSDWQFRVDEILKDREHQYVGPGSEITVIRTGGKVQWNGRTVIAQDTAFPNFVVGENYLLFLKSVPEEAKTFRGLDWGSFAIAEGKVTYLLDPANRDDDLAKFSSTTTADEFLALVRRSIQ